MKMHRVVLVEDNLDDQQFLLDLIDRVPFLTVVGTFADSVPALPFLSTQPVDLLLLDLHLPGLSGFALLRSLPNPPAVILTTSSLADSLEAFDVGVVDYLVKPIRYERFLRAVNRVLARQSELPVPPPPVSVPATILLKKGHESVRVALDDITYIEAFGAYSNVHLAHAQPLLVTHLLTELETKLPAAQFVRVHRSFIVAVARISLFSNNQLTFGERQIPVGRTYRLTLRQALDKRINP